MPVSDDAQAIINAIDSQTATVTASVYGNMQSVAQTVTDTQTASLGLWASAILGILVGYLLARGFVDPWRK